MNTYFHPFLKTVDGEEIEITAEYTITDFRPATYWEPAEGGEVEIVKAWYEPNGKPYVLNEDENEKWCKTITEEHDHSDNGDDGI